MRSRKPNCGWPRPASVGYSREMTIVEFPPIESADPSGLLALGGDLDVDSLLLAYRSGIFPWPFDERFVAWFAPPERAVLFLDKLHVSRSLRKLRARTTFTFREDGDFNRVIDECAKTFNRIGQRGTWITKRMKAAYRRLHEAGHCHSYECYDGERLVGGLYGVALGRFFAGESMFYREPNASKLAFWYLCERLEERSVRWIDCQVLTPLLESFGAEVVSRERYMQLLAEALTP